MKLGEEILKEHSKARALAIANYACQSNTNFKELMHCFLDDEYRLAQRGVWSVSWAAKQKPEMIYPYIKDLVSVLQMENVHDVVIKNSVRVLLTTLFNLSKDYPEIKPELKLIINDRLDYETEAFKSRAKKILPKL